MAADLREALDALDLAVARAAGVAGEEVVAGFARISLEARRRTGFLGESVVIALGGGTGVGKSSLLNALAGEQVAPTGALRPTTDRPLAWIPANPEPGLVRLLDSLGIEDRIGQNVYPHLAVLDLPDFDSVVGEHRATVEALLPKVDAVMWVVDPEKYNDRTLHADYLGPLAGYQGQFVFVMNQIDRLVDGEPEVVLPDFEQTLSHDGIAKPIVFALSAAPPGRSPEGLEPLRSYLAEKIDAKRVATGKLIEDLRRAGSGLADLTGVSPGEGLDYDRRWEEESGRATDLLVSLVAGSPVMIAAERAGERLARRSGGGPLGRLAALIRRGPLGRALGAGREEDVAEVERRRWEGRTGLERIMAVLGELIADLSFQARGAFGARLRAEFDDDMLHRQVRGSIEGAMAGVPAPGLPPQSRWWTAAGVVQLLLFLTLVGCGVWVWARPSSLERGDWPWPLIVAGAAVLVALGLAALVRRSGRRAGRAVAQAHRAAMETALADQLSRRIGVPLRSLVRERAELQGALTDLAVQVSKAEASLLKPHP